MQYPYDTVLSSFKRKTIPLRDMQSGTLVITQEVRSSGRLHPVFCLKVSNTTGLLAIATSPYSTLLAIAGRQVGHVQLIHLPPCPPPSPKAPPPPSPPRKPPPPPSKHPVSIIVAHTSALTSLSIPPSGRLLATTSVKGTLVRIWDSITGKLVRELRRGTDKAEIYGVAFRPDEQELCVWSDKGTVHVFTLVVSGAT